MMQTKSWIFSLLTTAMMFHPQSQAVAAVATYASEAQFIAAAGNIGFESFEQLSPRTRSADPVSVSFFSITPSVASLGVQDQSNTPEQGFGSFATDGSQYLLVYWPNQPTGSLRFDFAAPTTAFGFIITDVGEADGVVSIDSNAGETLGGLDLAQFPPQLGGGTSLFLGFTQDTPFTQLTLNVTGVDDAYGLDKVYAQPVPLPSGFWLFGSGLIAVVGRFRAKTCHTYSDCH